MHITIVHESENERLIELIAETPDDSILLEALIDMEDTKRGILRIFSQRHEEFHGVKDFVVSSRREVEGVLKIATLAACL